MKNILLLLICFSLLGYSQDSENTNTEFKRDKTGLFARAGVNLVDSTGEWGPFNTLSTSKEMAFENPFELGLEYRFNELFAVGLDGSINRWRVGEGNIDGVVLRQDTDYKAIDAKFKIFFDELFNIFEKWDWLDLYVDGGVGYFEIADGNYSGNFGIGLNARINKYTALYLDGTAKWSLDGNPYPESNHFQYAAGIMLRLSKLDSDKDGIKDTKDDCPYVFGPVENNGCPFPEKITEKETKIINQDSDGDGVVDDKDNCPDVPGLIQNFGCPDKDTDGDGVTDLYDKCPTIPANTPDGCPNNDRDGDGVKNDVDKCPDTFGPVENNGCPKDDVYIGENFDSQFTNVYFDFNKSSIKPQYIRILNDNAIVMTDNPNRKYTIVGHADNIGTAATNNNISIRRAQAVLDYLIKQGIPASSLKIDFKGDTVPIGNNKTQQGRALNRRVEFKSEKN